MRHPHPQPAQYAILADSDIGYYIALGQSRVAGSNDMQSSSRRSGTQLSTYRGTGFDYEDSRAYQAGDDMRNINWRLLARTASLHTKVFVEEREASVLIVIDRRAAMRFGTRQNLKVTRAVQLACFIAGQALRQDCSVGLSLIQSPSVWFMPQRSRSRIRDGLAAAASACPPLFVAADEITIEAVLAQLLHRAPARSRIVMISDFHDLGQKHQVLLAELSDRHTLLACQVLDPAELNLPQAGVCYLYDAGGKLPLKVNSADPALGGQYQQLMQTELDQIDGIFKASRIPLQRIHTNQSFESVAGLAAGV